MLTTCRLTVLRKLFHTQLVCTNNGCMLDGLRHYELHCLTFTWHVTCRGPISVALAVLASIWSGITASKVLARVSPALQDMKALVAYPCFLMYGAFALLTVY